MGYSEIRKKKLKIFISILSYIQIQIEAIFRIFFFDNFQNDLSGLSIEFQIFYCFWL